MLSLVKCRPSGRQLQAYQHIEQRLLELSRKRRANMVICVVHDALYRQAEKDWHSFVQKLTERLTEIDDTVPELPVKDVSVQGTI